MPPVKQKKKKTKKRRKGGKSKKKSGNGVYMSAFPKLPCTLIDMNNFVQVNLRLIDFNFASLSLVVPVTTKFATIARFIETKHADVNDLSLYMDPPQKENEITEFEKYSLSDYGIHGGPHDNPPSITMYFNFDVEQNSLGVHRALHQSVGC